MSTKMTVLHSLQKPQKVLDSSPAADSYDPVSAVGSAGYTTHVLCNGLLIRAPVLEIGVTGTYSFTGI